MSLFKGAFKVLGGDESGQLGSNSIYPLSNVCIIPSVHEIEHEDFDCCLHSVHGMMDREAVYCFKKQEKRSTWRRNI